MKKAKKGFTLIELFCIVVILALVIIMVVMGILKVINNSKKDSKLSQEDLLLKACESYINSNKTVAPKVIGDSVNIDLSILRNNNYLTKDIYNSKKESCMKNSYVRVYKLNKNEYTYLPYLYCGNEEKSDVEIVPAPSVKILFIDDNDESNNNLIFNNINESRIYLEIVGGEDSFGRQLEINNYEMTIYVQTKNNDDLVKAYSSGVISANKKYTYTLDQKIINYIDAYNATSINVVVVATNTLGGVSEVTSIAQANK